MAKKWKVTDLNVIKKEKGAFGRDMGVAHELLIAGILIRLGFDVSINQIGGVPYDFWLLVYERFPNGTQVPLRVQCKTVTPSGGLKFEAGGRAGVDRVTIPGKKIYKYTTKHNNLIVGIDRHTFDLYLVPTRFIKKWGKSRSISKLQPLKNNWDILLNWNDAFLTNLESALPR